MTNANVLMQGSLSDFNLHDVLQAVGFSRQHMLIELRREPRQVQGAIWLKAGRVLNAQCGEERGRDAFFDLFQSSADSFVVLRLQDPPTFREPVGHLQNLRLEAKEAELDALPEIDVDGASTIEVLDEAATPVSSAMATPTPPAVAAELSPFATEKPKPKLVVSSNEGPATESKPRSVAICSPKGGVGKTTLALNLASALAQRGVSTVLVDSDLNGDQMSLLNARERVQLGVYDILEKPESLNEALRDTSIPKLKILPAVGPELPRGELGRRDQSAAWQRLISKLGERFELVLVDCPAGMQGITQEVLSACSHALGVLQSEMIAGRNFELFEKAISAMPPERRPDQLGVVVNMFHGRSAASLEAFQMISSMLPKNRLFETTVPRHEAFQSASMAGLPLRLSENNGASSIAFLFDMMANELCTRLGMATKREAPKQFLT